jgi:2-polyprenyl-3-methyl-5-hydroxy-6-metoxy-1,4-benzoquinol methylase
MNMNADKYMDEHWIKNKIWTHLDWERHKLRLKLCALHLGDQGRRFIDVGCACGHSTAQLKRYRPGDWTGADFSHKGIELARKFFPGITFFFLHGFGELTQLGLFDGVVCSEVIEHVEDDAGLAEALMAITSCSLVVTTPTRSISDPGHLRLYNEKRLDGLFSGIPHEIKRYEPFFYLIGQKP